MKPDLKSALLACAILTAALAAVPPAALAAAEVVAAPTEELKLEIGKARLVRLDRPAATVFIADPKIADVQVKSPTLVYVVAKGVGSTTLIAVDAKDQLAANLGVTVGFDAPGLREALKRQDPGSQVEVSTANDALVLSGRVASAAEGDDILRTAVRYLPGDGKDRVSHLINRLTVDAPNQVNLRVRVAEVTRQANDILGFNWDALGKAGSFSLGLATGNPITAGASLSGAPRSQAGADNYYGGLKTPSVDVNTLIDALAQKKLVTVLAEPNLTAVSGEPASFLAGGEYPVPVPQGLNTTTIEYKKYGVSLAFVATILDGGRISLNVRPEVSQLSNSGAVVLNNITVPALTTRRAETTVELGSGQSFAIAGLLENDLTQTNGRTPGLGDAPLIGGLFRSRNLQKDQTELVIVVTPYLVKPTSQRLPLPTDLFEPDATDGALATAASAPAAASAEKKG